MRVTLVVDALAPQLGGIGRYTWELAQRLPSQRDINQVNYFARNKLIHDLSPLLNGDEPPIRGKVARWLERRRWRDRARSTVVHGPNYFLPRDVPSGIITVHDLSVFRYPETHPVERIRDFELQFSSSLERASHIITITETVRQEVIADLGISGDRITAIAHGVDPAFRPRSADLLRPALAKLGLEPGGYALSVSTLEPRKKLAELIQVWSNLPAALQQRTPLVLAGGSGWLNDSLHDQIRDGTAAGWLKHLGFIDEADLPMLYAGARLFLYPSIYEGFGLPPLEAMASGVPIVVADRSCLPEVCGDAARYVDPNDVPGFTEAVKNALLDEDWIAQARDKGLARASHFRWERCVAKTADVYRNHQP